jgi:hypothetical protein
MKKSYWLLAMNYELSAMFTPLNIDRSACPVKSFFLFNRGEADLTGELSATSCDLRACLSGKFLQ